MVTTPERTIAPVSVGVTKRRRAKGFDRPRFLIALTLIVYLALFVPILVVVVFSFNTSRSLQQMNGLGLHWYRTFMADATIIDSLLLSLEIAFVTMLVATALGTTLALGLVRTRSRLARPANILMLLPLVTPEIVTAVAALLLFSQMGFTLSVETVVIAHVTFSVSYVTVIVRGRLASLDSSIEEAGLDLGATRWKTVQLVILPQLWPAIAASAMLIFVMSFDDFVTSFFTSGSGVPPLPVRIYSMIKFSVSPEINAIGTTMMVITLGTVVAAIALAARSDRRA